MNNHGDAARPCVLEHPGFCGSTAFPNPSTVSPSMLVPLASMWQTTADQRARSGNVLQTLLGKAAERDS